MGSTLFSWKSGATKALAHYSQLCWVHVLQTHRSAESKYQKVTSLQEKAVENLQWLIDIKVHPRRVQPYLYESIRIDTLLRIIVWCWWLLLKPRISKSMIFGTTSMAGTQQLRFVRWFSFSIWMIFKGSMSMFRWENTSSIVAVAQLPCITYEVSEKIGLAYYINKNTFATFQKKLGSHVICMSHLSIKSGYCFQDFSKVNLQSLELPPVSLVASDLAT